MSNRLISPGTAQRRKFSRMGADFVNTKKMCDSHVWIQKKIQNDKVHYYCNLCGVFSKLRPTDFVELENKQNDEQNENPEESKCVHSWKEQKNHCHNKGNGNGKYRIYRCSYCNKFQKRY